MMKRTEDYYCDICGGLILPDPDYPRVRAVKKRNIIHTTFDGVEVELVLKEGNRMIEDICPECLMGLNDFILKRSQAHL